MVQKLRIAVVCSSNQNRSMEAHNFLSKRGFDVKSYGSGTHVKLPGSAPDKPNIYTFDTTYEEMYKDLLRRDSNLRPIANETQSSDLHIAANDLKLHRNSKKNMRHRYTQNGILHMLDRNKRIKSNPERFQEATDEFDLIITAEERVFDQVIEHLESVGQQSYTPVHVINIDIQDNHEEATLGAFLICEICKDIQDLDDVENEIDEVIQKFEKKSKRNLLHTVAFY